MAQQAAPTYTVDRSSALYERPALSVVDAPTFSAVKGKVESSFAVANVAGFLKSLERANLRVRDFEAVLHAGKLGPESEAQYGRLSGGDQGQIRELYLASLEQVELSLRDKYFKLYAYY